MAHHENLAKALFTHVKNNNITQLEHCLSRGDANSWVEAIRFELDLLQMIDNVLKDNKQALNLIQCTINTLSTLHLAALLGHNDCLVTLLDKSVSVETSLTSGSTCLHLASFGGKIGTVRLLLDVYNADVSRQDKYGWTALHYASIEGNLELIRMLVGHGADITVRDQDGTCAALRAKWRGHEHIVAYFCSLGDDDYLLNINESYLTENGDPDNTKVNRSTSKDDTAVKSKKEDKKYNRTSGDKSLLENYIPPPSRQHSVPVGKHGGGKSKMATSGSKSNSGNNMAQTLPTRFKDARLHRIRRVIRNEIEAAFSDYEQPIEANGLPPVGNSASGSKIDEESAIIMAGVGVKTMTRLMREEIQKYRNGIFSPTGNGGYLNAKSAGNRQSQQLCVENDIYEDDYQTLDKFGPAPVPPESNGAPKSTKSPIKETDIYKSFVPPPLPPRNYIKNAPKGTLGDTWDMDELAESLRIPGQQTDRALTESIKKLSVILGGSWKALAKALPLAPVPEFVDIRVLEIEKTFLGNVEKQALVMLMEWRLNRGITADVDTLILGLRKCGLKDKIVMVETIAQEFTA